MIICPNCHKRKRLSSFNKGNSPGGISWSCKVCCKKDHQKYYLLHREEINRKNKYYDRSDPERAKMRHQRWNLTHRHHRYLPGGKCYQKMKYVVDLFKKFKCIDCGEGNIAVLEFDHLKNKVAGIMKLVYYKHSLNDVQKEVKKCEIVCQNCHHLRTLRRKNAFIYLLSKNEIKEWP